MRRNISIITLILSTLLFIYIITKIYSAKEENTNKILEFVLSSQEKAYAEGQSDALKNEIRLDIKRNCWIKNPWDNSTKIHGDIKMCKKENK